MKQHLFLIAIAALTLSACGPVYVVHQDPPPPAPEQQAADPGEVSYQSFYDQLSPYGQWVDNPQYGYVWLPDAGPDFKPYSTNGHWVYTEEGWTWSSDYPWGWAAFHYGRWFFQDGYGWMWVPGQEWAPAWVSWRNSSDYYGWAPLGPNVSIGASFGGGYNPPPHYWNFVPHQYVTSPQVRNYYVNESRNVTIINNTTVINNTVIVNNGRTGGNNRGRNNYAGGPDANEAGRFSGAPIRPVAVRDGRGPGEQNNNGGLTVYRPRVNTTPPAAGSGVSGRPGFAPARVQPLNNARPVNTTVYNGGGRGNNGNNGGNDNNANDRNGGDRNGNDRNNTDRNNNAGRPSDRGTMPPTPATSSAPVSQPQPVPAGSGQPYTRPIAQPVNPPVNQGYNRPFNQPNNAPNNQPNTQATTQPAPNVMPAAQPVQGTALPSGRPGRPIEQHLPVQNSATGQQPMQQQPAQHATTQQVPNRVPITQQRGIQPANSQPQPAFNRNNSQPGQPAFKTVTNPNAPKPAPKPVPITDDKKKDEPKKENRP